MHTITNWQARRAGLTQTITGKDASGASVKVTGIKLIGQPTPGGPVLAERIDGTEYLLA